MRRRGLLVLLWLVGTAVAAGVVLQAVMVMTHTFRDVGESAGAAVAKGKRTAQTSPATTTTGAASTSVGTTVAGTEPATVQPATAVSNPATTVGGITEPTSSPRTAPTVPQTARSVPTATTEVVRTTAPTVATTAPVATPAPTVAPTDPPATTAPPGPATTKPSSCPTPYAFQRFSGGPNKFYVKYCADLGAVQLAGSPVPGVGYTPNVQSAGPPQVEVTFTGATTYHCLVYIEGGLLLGNCG